MACVKHPLLTIRSALKRVYAYEMAESLARWQLTGMEMDVLLFLGNNPGYDTASDMVQLCQLTKSHVSKAVESLTERGLIIQERDQRNRRRIHLKMTPEAAPILKEGQAAQTRFVEVLTRGLTEEDKTALKSILETMARNAVEEGESQEARG